MDERQRFEEWLIKDLRQFPDAVEHLRVGDGYAYPLDNLWKCWQARAAQEPRPGGESAGSVCPTDLISITRAALDKLCADKEELQRYLLELAAEGMIVCAHSVPTPGCWKCEFKSLARGKEKP